MPALPISTVRNSSSLSTFRLISQLNADQADVISSIELGGRQLSTTITDNGGLASTILVIQSATASTFLSDLGRERGITTNRGATDLIVTRTDGVELEIDLDGASSIQDVIDLSGAIDTLLRLEDAILDGDVVEIGRLQAKLNVDLDTASRSRGKVGVWSRNLDQLKTATEASVIQMQSQLSEEVDADFAQVVSDLQ